MIQPVSLYFHVPFCRTRCPYCDFYSTTDLALREDYTRALVRAVEGCPAPPGTPVPTVYFGGGTPYLLGDGLLQVLEAVQGRFSLLEDCEITLEANPGDLEEEGLRRLREGGFCRLSLGLQAGEAEGLGLLGRRHTPEDTARAVEWARAASFGNLSLDLMLAPILPYTAEEIWSFIPESKAYNRASVMLNDMPEYQEGLVPPAFMEKWERLHAIRDDVNKALELARADQGVK